MIKSIDKLSLLELLILIEDFECGGTIFMDIVTCKKM